MIRIIIKRLVMINLTTGLWQLYWNTICVCRQTTQWAPAWRKWRGSQFIVSRIKFWQRQIQQVLATNDIEWNKEQMIRWLCSDAPEMSMEEAWYPRPKLPPKGKKVKWLKCLSIAFVEDYKILHLDSILPGRDVRGRRRVCPRNLWGSPCLCGPSSPTCTGRFVMMMMVVMVVVVVWF